MEFQFLIDLLWKRRWLILSTLLIASVATFFITGLLEDKYKSDSVVTTGIVKYRGVTLTPDNPFIQKFQIESAFNDRMELLKSRRVIRLLSNALLEHDLTAQAGDGQPFRHPNLAENGLTAEELNSIGTALFVRNDSVSQTKVEQINNRRLNDVLKAYRYDYESLISALGITRVSDTDLLNFTFTSESPELSHYALTTYLNDFFDFYEDEILSSEGKTVKFYREWAAGKKDSLDAKTRQINYYNQSERLVDLEAQSETVVNQLKDLELELEKEKGKIPGLKSSINSLRQYIQKYNRDHGSAYADDAFFKTDIQEISSQIETYQNQYVESGYSDESAKEKVESLRLRKEGLLKRLAKKRFSSDDNLQERNEKLIQQRIEKELELERAQANVFSLTTEINSIRGRQSKLVGDNAQIQQMNEERKVLQQEYLEIMDKLQDAELAFQGTENPMEIIEYPALPEKPESKNRALLAAFSGVAGASLATMFILFLGLIDRGYRTVGQLKNFIDLPVLGLLQNLKGKNQDVHQILTAPSAKKSVLKFRESLRKLRFVIDQAGGDVFLFTSPKKGEGKTSIATLLAATMSNQGNSVLLIDANFKNNTLSQNGVQRAGDVLRPGMFYQEFAIPDPQPLYLHGQPVERVSLLPNSGGYISPIEIATPDQWRLMLLEYKSQFDYIFIEGPACNDYADSLEIAPFCDQTIYIIDANSKRSSKDEESVRLLKATGTPLLGVIFNRAAQEDSL